MQLLGEPGRTGDGACDRRGPSDEPAAHPRHPAGGKHPRSPTADVTGPGLRISCGPFASLQTYQPARPRSLCCIKPRLNRKAVHVQEPKQAIPHDPLKTQVGRRQVGYFCELLIGHCRPADGNFTAKPNLHFDPLAEVDSRMHVATSQIVGSSEPPVDFSFDKRRPWVRTLRDREKVVIQESLEGMNVSASHLKKAAPQIPDDSLALLHAALNS